MIAELGHLSLILSLCFALLLAVVPLFGASKNHWALMQSSQWLSADGLLVLKSKLNYITEDTIKNRLLALNR